MFARTLRSIVLGAALFLSVGPAAAAAATHAPSSKPAVRHDTNQHSIARSCGPDCLIVTAYGFSARESVRMRELRRPGWQRMVRADRAGRLAVRVQRTGPAGDVVTFVGLGGNEPAAGGNVSVSVPRIAVYRISPR